MDLCRLQGFLVVCNMQGTTYQEIGACAGNETQSIIAGLHILPEVHVGVIEDVRVHVEVVETLR
jgi:hypothetical protein